MVAHLSQISSRNDSLSAAQPLHTIFILHLCAFAVLAVVNYTDRLDGMSGANAMDRAAVERDLKQAQAGD